MQELVAGCSIMAVGLGNWMHSQHPGESPWWPLGSCNWVFVWRPTNEET